jgi:hypothetical protein
VLTLCVTQSDSRAHPLPVRMVTAPKAPGLPAASWVPLLMQTLSLNCHSQHKQFAF